jgi:PAS domain S-box-containing protein
MTTEDQIKKRNGLKQILGVIADPVIVIDYTGQVIAANSIIGKYTKPAEELVDKNIFEQNLFDEKQAARIKENIAKRLKGTHIEPYEIMLKNENGQEAALEINAKKIEYNGDLLDVIVLRDVTKRSQERKELESNLSISENKFREVSDNTFDGILLFNVNEEICYWNAAAERIYGFDKKEILGKKLKETIIPPNAFDLFSKIKDNFINKKYRGIAVESLQKRKNGTEFLAEISLNTTKIGEEELAIASVRDISEHRDNEEKFNGITRSIKDAVILVDDEARVTYWNPAAEKTFGYTDKEALGKSIHELVMPESAEMTKERLDESVKAFSETGIGYFTVGNVEVKGRRKNGSEFPAELSISPIKLGGKWNAVGVVKDITNRKISSQKLWDAEQKYHMLFSQAPVGVLVIDPETAGFAEFNDITHLQLGYTRGEFEKLTLMDLQVEDTPVQLKAQLKQIIHEGSGEYETKHRAKTGEFRSVITTAKPFKNQGKTYIHCIVHDVTENKKTQNALATSESRYRQLVELAQEGIWAIDNDLVTTFVNPRMARMLGYEESEMRGKSILEFVDSTWTNRICGIIKAFNGGSAQYEYAFSHKKGDHVDTIVTLSVITDDMKEKIGFLAVISDITERKRAEKALKASEELSRAIVANSPIGIATSDSTYHFLSANEAFCNILGYSEAELRKLTFTDVTHPDELPKTLAGISALEKGEIQCFEEEKKYMRKDGGIITGRVIVNAIRDSNGKPSLIITELEEITKRKKLEEDLKASEERFRAISTSAMDAIILSDQNDKILYWNPAAEKLYGYSEKEAIGKKLSELILPAKTRKNHAALLNDLANQDISKREFCITARNKNGATFPVDLSIVSVDLQNQKCLLTIVKDITEWKKMEEKLRQERDLLDSVTISTNILLAIITRDYRITWINQKGHTAPKNENVEGQFCYKVFGRGSPTVCEGCGVKRVFENGENLVRRDYSFIDQGKEKWVELISTPIKDKNGKVIAALEISIDINERKQLQNKLAMYSQRLEEIVQKRTDELKKTQAELVKSERLAAIGELAGMIGHDLRNPLSGIKNSTYYLKKKGKDLTLQEENEMLEIIDKCVNYSNRIINDLLDYSREIHLTLEQQTPRRLLQDALSIITIPKSIIIDNKLKDTPTINVDPDKMNRVIINLIKNAVDAMPNGGVISLKSRKAADTLKISFTDTGMGISEEILPKLFTPLCTTKAQGMGFGLAICKRIIEAHKGTIAVKTVKCKGATFTITLPLDLKVEGGGETHG